MYVEKLAMLKIAWKRRGMKNRFPRDVSIPSFPNLTLGDANHFSWLHCISACRMFMMETALHTVPLHLHIPDNWQLVQSIPLKLQPD